AGAAPGACARLAARAGGRRARAAAITGRAQGPRAGPAPARSGCASWRVAGCGRGARAVAALAGGTGGTAGRRGRFGTGGLVGPGVDYRFETTAAGLRAARGRVRAVRLAGGDDLPADVVVLAVGHSARPVYTWAVAAGVALERKPIAIGVRIEHPQRLIDEIQYGDAAGHPKLPPAFYELTSAAADRGVYSFCMCPGGWIVPAATEADG